MSTEASAPRASDLDLLRSSPLLALLPPEQVDALLDSARVHRVDQPQVLLHAGETADWFYVLLDGPARVHPPQGAPLPLEPGQDDPGEAAHGWGLLRRLEVHVDHAVFTDLGGQEERRLALVDLFQ